VKSLVEEFDVASLAFVTLLTVSAAAVLPLAKDGCVTPAACVSAAGQARTHAHDGRLPPCQRLQVPFAPPSPSAAGLTAAARFAPSHAYAVRTRRRFAAYLRLRLLELRKAGLERAAAVIERRLPVDALVPEVRVRAP